jgi:UPF0271 protein
MRECVALALEHGVAIGAHPSFPDLTGFGRRPLTLPMSEVEQIVRDQVGALAAIAAVEGATLQHVKPHGALYNMAATNAELADAIVRAMRSIDPSLMLFGPPASALLEAGRRAGLRIAAEGFADRAYCHDRSLLPRDRRGAVISDADTVVDRAIQIVRDRTVTTVDEQTIPLDVDTICVHGDTPDAADLVARVRTALERAGVQVVAVGA